MARDTDWSSYILPAAGVGGASYLGALTARPLLERALLERVTRKGSKYSPVMRTTIPPDLWNGSGEARMSLNLQNLLKQHGINSVYAPDPNGSVKPIKEDYYKPIKGNNRASRIAAVLDSNGWNGYSFKPGDVVPKKGLKRLSGIKDLIDASAKNNKWSAKQKATFTRKFLNLVGSGKFDGMTATQLRDLAKLDINLLHHPEKLSSLKPGQGSMFFNGFRGFKASWNPGIAHVNNWYNSFDYGGELNLGKALNFGANYSEGSRHFIPGTRVYDPWLNRLGGVGAKIQHNRDRRTLEDLIRRTRAASKLDSVSMKGKKLIFMDSGSVGPNSEQRIKDLADALKGRKDVHVLFQTGKTTFAPNLESVLKDINAKNPGLITATERVDAPLMNKLMNGADLHITYGGSSSAGEAGSHLTPTLFAQDGDLNKGNSDFVSRMRNRRGGIKIKTLDNITTAVDTEIRNELASKGGKQLTDSQIKEVLQRLNGRTRVDLGTVDMGRSLMNDALAGKSDIVNKARAMNKGLLDEMLSASVQKNRYSKGNIRAAREYINAVHEADRHAVGTVRSAILDMLNRDDLSTIKRIKADIGALFRNKGFQRGAAAKRLFSLKGLKKMNMSLGNLVAKTPLGRRLALPGILGAAAVGGYGVKKLFGSRDNT